MAWKVEYTDIAERALEKLDPQVRKRINSFFRKRVTKD
jgi:mRNA-degrading endonuclease RelE of RelBE toxin-antitoxin system